MIYDESHYFSLFRNVLKLAPSKARSENDASLTNGVVHEALTILSEKNDAAISVHLQFLSAHVIWQSLFSNERSTELAAIQSRLPDSAVSLVDALLSKESSSRPEISSRLPLSAVDLSILNGFINASADCGQQFLHFIFPLVLGSLKYGERTDILDPYQHLQVLNNGLEKMTKNRKCSSHSLPTGLLAEVEGAIVRPYWDCRFSGCAELALNCMRAVLRSLERTGRVEVGTMITRYADNRRYPWYLRGKYRLLAVLTEFCSLSEFLQCQQQLLNNLTAGLAATHVAPFTSAVYKTVLNNCTSKKTWLSGGDQALATALKRWVFVLLDHLLSDNRQVASNAAKYWLPAVAKFVPDGCDWLMEGLAKEAEDSKWDSGERLWCDQDIAHSLCHLDYQQSHGSPETKDKAWLLWSGALIRRHARHWKRVYSPLKDDELAIGLRHLDDHVRLEYFVFLVDVPGKYAPLPPDRYLLISQFLFDNLIVASSYFRRRCLSCFSKWFKATADHCVKTCNFDEFGRFTLDHLISPAFDHIYPGANYQRLTTTLGLLQSILDCVESNDALWKTLDMDSVLVRRDFGSQLLWALQNSSDDIRCRSANLLTTYFTFPFYCAPPDIAVVHQLCTTASALCRSPKAIDCDIGALLWQLIVEKLVIGERCLIGVGETECVVEAWSPGGLTRLLTDFLGIMRCEFGQLRSNLQEWSAVRPLHGWGLALTNILSTVRSSSIPLPLLTQLVDLACSVVDFMLNALGSPAEGVCPSLAEMQYAMGDTALPLEQQVLLACCWLNVKAFAGLMAEVAHHTVHEDSSVISRIGLALFDAMSRTRHFGALEGCNWALSKYLRLCLSSDRPDIARLPGVLLDKVLDHVEAPKRVSVTRRAVGYPIMMECIVAAGWAIKKRDFVTLAFQRLLSIAESSCALDVKAEDDKCDVNVVRAMHCLRLLLRSSSLDSEVLPYVAGCYRLAVLLFCNPVWSIRNAAMLILSAVLWRLFGRREVKEDDDKWVYGENRMDLLEFHSHFPNVWAFFCQQLKRMAVDRRTVLHSQLFPLLCLAQNLVLTDCDGCEALAADVNRTRAASLALLFRTPDARLKRVIARVTANFVTNNANVRRSMFVQLHGHLLDEKGRLDWNDRQALWQLAVALELEHTADDQGPALQMKTPTQRDKICLNLKSRFLLEFPSVPYPECEGTTGRRGMSAECLALPVELRMLAGEQCEDNRLLKYIQRVLGDVGHCQNELRRLSAARSFCYLKPVVKKIYETDESGELAAANAELIMALCALLSDEDETVRYVASWSASRDPNSPSSPVDCLKDLLDECIDQPGSPVCQLFVQRILAVHDDQTTLRTLSDMIDDADGLTGHKNFLFAQQDYNIYKEDLFHLRLFCQRWYARWASLITADQEHPLGRWKLAPAQLVELCARGLEKMKVDGQFRRRHQQTLLLVSSRLMVRNGLMSVGDSEEYTRLGSLMTQLFGHSSVLIIRDIR